jgi:hypothetical protein
MHSAEQVRWGEFKASFYLIRRTRLPSSYNTSPFNFRWRFIRKVCQESFQGVSILVSQVCFQCMSQSTLNTTFPTGTEIVQVCSPSSSLTSRIDQDSLWCSYNPDQRSFWQNLPAPYTGALRYMLDPFTRSFSHLLLSKICYSSHSQPVPSRLCFFFARTTSRSGS